MLLDMQESQGITPPALERRPVLTAWQNWLSNQFSRLSRDRLYTEGGPLPLSTGAIRTYYDSFELHDFEFETIYEWMVRIDGMWLDEVAKRRERETKASENKTKSSPTPRAKR